MKTLTVGKYELLNGWIFRVLKGEIPRLGEAKFNLFYKKEFEREIEVKGVVGTISSFPRLHVSLLLSINPIPKRVAFPPIEDIIFIINSGSQGTANNSISNLSIRTKTLYFYYWAHNMYPWKCDFHSNLTVYYEELEESQEENEDVIRVKRGANKFFFKKDEEGICWNESLRQKRLVKVKAGDGMCAVGIVRRGRHWGDYTGEYCAECPYFIPLDEKKRQDEDNERLKSLNEPVKRRRL